MNCSGVQSLFMILKIFSKTLQVGWYFLEIQGPCHEGKWKKLNNESDEVNLD